MLTFAPDVAALYPLGWPRADTPKGTAWRAQWAQHPGTCPARVAAQHRSGYQVAIDADTLISAQSPPEWRRGGHGDPSLRAVVGDWVLLDGEQIVSLLPRYSAIRRAAAGESPRQQWIAANVDVAFIVCGLDGDFNPRRIERYLLLVPGGNLTPVVVLTKADRIIDADVAAARAALRAIIAQNIAVLALDARDPASAVRLAPWLAPGATAVLIGSSGAGKSTLTNTLLGRVRMKTGEVRRHDSRGRHTTTHRALIPLPGGACLIDTPGLRAVNPTGEETLAHGGFADIEELAEHCRFRDCRHHAEPGCAVRAAITAGTLDARRLDHYHKLHAEIASVNAAFAMHTRSRSTSRRAG